MKILQYIHNVGLLIVLICSFMILVLLQDSIHYNILFSIGVFMVVAGRFIGSKTDFSLSKNKELDIVVRRLYRQRVIAACILCMSVVLLFLPNGFYFGYYIRRSLWFIPFLIFTIIEIYTTFRLSSIDKKGEKHINYK